jgi:hypothetical protein
MRKALALLVAALLLMTVVLALAPGAGASGLFTGDPCDDSAHPGQSEYAKNHIVHIAQTGLIKEHKPGHHQGLAGLCG